MDFDFDAGNCKYVSFEVVIALFKRYPDVKFRRQGWNGENMWIQCQRPDKNSKMTQPYIYIKTADDELVPWVASQTDLFAEDWEQLPLE